VHSHSGILGNCAKSIVFVQPRSEKFQNCEQKHWFDQLRRENFGTVNKSTVFCQPRSENFMNLPTEEATQINCICSAVQRKFL
jgi:glutamine synthetase